MIRKTASGAAITVLAITAALACLAPAANAATVTPSGIDSTGTQDDTAALQRLIDSLADGSTLVFPQGGSYRIEGTLHVKTKSNLTIEGNGALFFATTTGDRTRSQWSFEGGSNIVVRDVVVKGANPNAGTGSTAYVVDLEAQHAFNIWSTNGIELDHVTATDTYGDFVYIGAQSGGLARNVYVHDSNFDRNGRQGISITGANGVRIIHNTIADTRRATFDLEPNGQSWGALNVDIEDNTIGAGRLNLLSSQGIGPVSDITFAHNTINRPVTVVVNASDGGRRGPFIIADNVATHSWGSPAGSAALSFSNIDRLTVTGNTIPLQAGRGDYGVKALNSCDVTVTGNTFSGAISDSYVTPAGSCATPTVSQPITPTTTTTPTTVTTPPTATTSAPTAAPKPAPAPGRPSGAQGVPSAQSNPPSSPSATTANHATGSISQEAKPSASASSKAHTAVGSGSSRSTPPTAKGRAPAVVTAPDSRQLGGATYLAASDTAATAANVPRLLSRRVLAATIAALTVLLVLGARLLGARRMGSPRTARRRQAPTPTPGFAMEILPQRFAR